METKLCKYCKTPIADKIKIFCNSSCSAKFNNTKRRTIKNCLGCNQIIKNLRRKKQKYCSVRCQQALKKEERYQKLLSGDDSDIGHIAAKNVIISKHGAKCMECGWDKINLHTGKCPIELEHIDGNSKNNKLQNLKLLCPNCHSLTSTYKALNKGNGRHERMKRYNEGKSY